VGRAILSAVGAGYVSLINKGIRTWLLDYTNKVRAAGFQEAAFSESPNVWEIYDGVEVKDASGNDISGRRLLIRIEAQLGSAVLKYKYFSGGQELSGEINFPKDLLAIIPLLG